MAQYIITLSDAEDKALGFVALSQQEWIDNAIKTRCAAAIEEIVAAEVQRKLAAGETISGSKEDIVNAAPIESAAQREAKAQAEAAQAPSSSAQQGA
jgi:hypothetical protein